MFRTRGYLPGFVVNNGLYDCTFIKDWKRVQECTGMQKSACDFQILQGITRDCMKIRRLVFRIVRDLVFFVLSNKSDSQMHVIHWQAFSI